MTDTGTRGLADFLDAPIVRRYLDEIVADTEAALTAAAGNLRSGALAHCTRASLSAYRSDKAACAAASADFHDAWNRVINEEVETLDAFQDAYQTLLLSLELLEEENLAFGAVVQTDLGAKLAAFFPLVVLLGPFAQRWGAIRSDLDGILKDLDKASRAANAKAAKTAIATAVAAGTMLYPPATIGATISVSIGSAAVGLVIDAVIGNGAKVGALDTANKVAGTSAKCFNLASAGSKAVGPFVNGVNVLLGLSDTAAALAKKARLGARAERLKADYDRLFRDLRAVMGKLPAAQAEANAAHAEAVRLANRHRSRTGARKGLLKEAQSYR